MQPANEQVSDAGSRVSEPVANTQADCGSDVMDSLSHALTPTHHETTVRPYYTQNEFERPVRHRSMVVDRQGMMAITAGTAVAAVAIFAAVLSTSMGPPPAPKVARTGLAVHAAATLGQTRVTLTTQRSVQRRQDALAPLRRASVGAGPAGERCYQEPGQGRHRAHFGRDSAVERKP